MDKGVSYYVDTTCKCGLICTGDCTPEARAFRKISAGYDGPITHTREGGPEYPNRKPKQTDTPVQIRRARGAFIRARQEEEVGLSFLRKDVSGWSTRYGYGSACQAQALNEYARAVCHALQWLLS